jgi:hypothetical protein
MVQATTTKVQSTWKVPPRLINNISSIETKKMAAPRKPYAIWLIPIYVEWWMILIKRAVRKVAAKVRGIARLIDQVIPLVIVSGRSSKKVETIKQPAN